MAGVLKGRCFVRDWEMWDSAVNAERDCGVDHGSAFFSLSVFVGLKASSTVASTEKYFRSLST